MPAKIPFEDSYIPEPMSGCWLWLNHIRPNGYGYHCVNGKRYFAHRASWILHRGPIPKGINVLHKCDTRSCVAISHLYLGTAKDNMRDAMQRGHWRAASGERAGKAKLTESEAKQVYDLRRSTLSGKAVADAYGINHRSVYAIWKGIYWQAITGAADDRVDYRKEMRVVNAGHYKGGVPRRT